MSTYAGGTVLRTLGILTYLILKNVYTDFMYQDTRHSELSRFLLSEKMLIYL